MFPAIDWEHRRMLVVGGGGNEALQTRVREFGIERVIYLESLPLDRRHNAKIDYPALREMVRKYKEPRHSCRGVNEGRIGTR